VSSTITIGTAPDSRGVWFPSDPEQVPPEVFLREVAQAPALEALAGLGRDIEGIFEHDLYSVPARAAGSHCQADQGLSQHMQCGATIDFRRQQ
jgi:hypothetical protein